MFFDFLKKQSWGLVNCLTGEFHAVEKLPFEIGTADGVDLRLPPGEGIAPKHCALTRVRNGSLRLVPLEAAKVNTVLNGATLSEPHPLLPKKDYTMRLGPHLLALHGGADLKTWRARIDSKHWLLYRQDVASPPLGPVEFDELLELAARHDLPVDTTAAHPVGLQVGFWLKHLLPLLESRGVFPVSPSSAAIRQLEVTLPVEMPRPAPLVADKGELTCPVCWLHCDVGDLMHVAVHDSLRGDPVLGEDAHQRFHATRFNDRGQALDAMGLPCADLACPHCRSKLPPGFIDAPHHIFSLVGNLRAGKSYYLSILAKHLPALVYRQLELVWQDADPAGNALLNAMKNGLHSAGSVEEAAASVIKTVLGGAMYVQTLRHGRKVAMPRPFVFNLSRKSKREESLSLIFYDNAGEHFQPGVRIEDSPGALHVAAAGGIFFLFDPTGNYDFRRRLAGNSNDPQLTAKIDDIQDVILAEMKTRIMKMRGLGMGEKIDVPLAVIVGKLDAWRQLLPADQPLCECLDARGEGLKLDAIAHNSEITRNLLLDICPTIVANAESLSRKVCYFPVSAFGHTPVRTDTGAIAPDPARLAPILLEVPTLWMLHEVAPDFIRIAGPSSPENTVTIRAS